tara:strand:+ start:242 stop:610 length:369 start_codon:yes stop_codon:yes gene_type:complete
MLTFGDIQKKIIYFCCIVILFGFIVFGVRSDNHFYGLNESSDLIDCIFYSSIVFSGSGYAEIHPQTSLGRMIVLVLSIIKIFIIVYPLEKLEGEYFEIEQSKITLEDVDKVVKDMELPITDT